MLIERLPEATAPVPIAMESLPCAVAEKPWAIVRMAVALAD